MKKPVMKKVTFAVATLSACVSLADTVTSIQDNFEGESTAWTGGTTSAGVPAAPANGYPISGDHTQVLDISGVATRTVNLNDTANLADFLVKISLPEEGDDPTISGDAPLLALATNSDGNLYAYCKENPNSANPSWQPLGDATYAKDTWVRITVLLDYPESGSESGSFMVAVNGNLVGPYYLANNASTISSIKISGLTAIDDLVVKNTTTTASTYDKYASVNTEGAAATVTASDSTVVPVNFLTANSLPATTAGASTDLGGGFTVAKAYVVGVAPTEGAKFEIEEATSDGTNLVLTFPGDWPAGSYIVKYGNAANDCNTKATPTSAVKDGDSNTVTIPLNSLNAGDVLYYKVTRTM